jgi:hypothetical protein
MVQQYPFENLRAKPHELELFKKIAAPHHQGNCLNLSGSYGDSEQKH